MLISAFFFRPVLSETDSMGLCYLIAHIGDRRSGAVQGYLPATCLHHADPCGGALPEDS